MDKRPDASNTHVKVVECAHFWRIESPAGPTSRGKCKHCGSTQEFMNSIPVTVWGRSTPETRKAAAAKR
ncbi:MAG: hypothetical protein EXR57_01665 [Dehalococcoidia bacterium]|nr:hypothetical protein [Dehalococcoidia bacterium]MSQ34511.1 hypothetical protein [Dehalococcoidia bacterium]